MFGCTNQRYSDEFAYMMSEEYHMSRMGELKFFLGLQISQQHNVIFISQEKYLKDVLRKFGMQDCKGVKIPMPTNGHLCTDENGKTSIKRYTTPLLALYCIYVHLGQILCLVFACVPDFKLHRRNHTIRL